MFVLTESWIE